MPKSKTGKFVTNPFTGDRARIKTPRNITVPPKDTEEFDGYYRPGPSRPTELKTEYSHIDSRRSRMASVHDADDDGVSPRTVSRHDWAFQPAVRDFGDDMDYHQARVAYEDNHSYPGAYPRTPYQRGYDVSPLEEEFDEGRKASVITTFPGASFDMGKPEPAKRAFAGSPEKLRPDVDSAALRNEAQKAHKQYGKKKHKPAIIRMLHFIKKAPNDADADAFLFTRDPGKKKEELRRKKQGLALSKGKSRAIPPEQPYGHHRAHPVSVPSRKHQEKVRDQDRDDSITSMDLPFAVSKSVQYDAQQTYVDMYQHKNLPHVPAGAVPGTSLGPQARENIPRKRQNLPPSPPPPLAPLKGRESKKGKEKAAVGHHAPLPPQTQQYSAPTQEKRYVTLEDIQALKPIRKIPSPEKVHKAEHANSSLLWRTASHIKAPPEAHGKADASGKKKKNLKDMISGPVGEAILEATTYEGNGISNAQSLRRKDTRGHPQKGKQPETSRQPSTNRKPKPPPTEHFPDLNKHPTWKHFRDQYKGAKEATHFDQARKLFHMHLDDRRRKSSDASFHCVGVDADQNYGYTPRGPYDSRRPSYSEQDLVKPKQRFAPPPIDTNLANDLIPRPLFSNTKVSNARRRRSASETTTRDTRFYQPYNDVLHEYHG
jgi:hypothetical protein